MPSTRSTVLAAMAVGLIGTSALAQAPQAPVDGAALAEMRCGRCHATGLETQSPQRGVIPFQRLHERYPVDMLADAARTGTIAGHDEMPMFQLTAAEVRALLEHIDSLAPDKPGYVTRVPAHR